MPTVSHSEVDSYLLCRRKHYYGYSQSLQRITESDSLFAGKAVHRILEAFYTAILDAGPTVPEQQAAWDDAYRAALDEHGKLAAEGYQEADKRATLDEMLFSPVGYFIQEPFTRNGWLILAVEKEFVLEYDSENDGKFPLVVDLVVKDPDGLICVVDHKTTYDFYTTDAAELQPQVPKYIGALRALGFRVSHGWYNQIRTRKIKAPTADQMHRLLPVMPSTERVVRTFEEQMAVATEVERVKALPLEQQDRLAFRVANKMVCQSCSFKDLCQTELAGGNVELMKKTEYKIRERREFNSPTNEEEPA